MIRSCRSNNRSCDARVYRDTYCRILNRMIAGMTEACLSDSISHNFIVQMIPHHRAAIEMSENILQYTHSEALREIARGIITEQTQSIQNMETILCRCSAQDNCPGEVKEYQRQVSRILHTMFTEMRNARFDRQISCDFMREMIPHHRGAVRMSENALQYRICPELTPILDAIIRSQERGIRQMEQLLCSMRCAR